MLVVSNINVLWLEFSPSSGNLNSLGVEINQPTMDVISLLRCFSSAFIGKPVRSFSSRLRTPSA